MTGPDGRIEFGRVIAFNLATWWGYIATDSRRGVEFHASCVEGARTDGLPGVGDRVAVVWSDATCERLLSVRIC